MDHRSKRLAYFERHFGSDARDRDLSDWLFERGSGLQALLAAELFMPELVEISGSVLLAVNASRFREKINEGASDLAALERSFNWVEVPYTFCETSSLDDEGDSLLAQAMRDAWAGLLRRSYPDRSFNVRVIQPSETGSVVGVGFHELRS